MTDGSEQQTKKQSLEKRIEELEATLKEHTAGWQRARADYQNLKRESEEKQHSYADLTRRRMLQDLLPIYDLLKRATETTPDAEHVTSWISGVQQIVTTWKNLLTRWQVTTIDTENKSFDPSLHEAVGTDGNMQVGAIVKELEGGYMVNGVLVRPAKVIVGTKEEGKNKAS
ncbi:MAG: nucleotide exchange factor GrpE [Patescibacteria group bacterium]|jgi:molecular chaperone GrpE